MPQDSGIQSFVTSPLVGYAAAALLLVLGWKMNATWANWIVALAWAVLVFSAFRTQPLASTALIPRVMCTLVVAGMFGLLIYPLWSTAKDELAASEDGIPSVMPLFVECRHSAPPTSPAADGRMNV